MDETEYHKRITSYIKNQDQDEIKEKLDKRGVIREQKAFLHLLLKISESITRLESLLLITSPEDAEKDSTGVAAVSLPSRTDGDSDDR